MIAKITLTLEQDEDRGTNAAMEETIKLLSEIEGLPTMKVVLTLECEDIIAKIATKTEEQIIRYVMPMTTPMDDLLDDERGVTRDAADLFPDLKD